MNKHLKRFNILIINCFVVGIFIIFICSPSLVFSQGPYGPGMGSGMGPGMGSGMGPGMGRGMGSGLGPGMGLHRENCSRTCRGEMNLQRGIMNEPPYCRMLLDRPDINLTPKQRDQIKKLQIDHMKDTFDLRTDLQIQKIELKKLRFSKNPSFEDIKAKLGKISKLQLELQIKRAKLQLEADKILTESQKDLLYLSPGMSVDIEWGDSAGEEEGPKPDA
ncbi:MAG: Spy/CpxP family protein refolding chaperone [bacterium]